MGCGLAFIERSVEESSPFFLFPSSRDDRIECKRSSVDWKFDAAKFTPVVDPDGEPFEKPQRTLALTTQKLHEIDPPWQLVAETLRAVARNKHRFGYHNFCVLACIAAPENYIQTVYPRPESKRCPGGWRLERREYSSDGGYTHYFAQMASAPEDSDTVPQFQTVIDAFHAFYYNKSWPENVHWQVYNI